MFVWLFFLRPLLAAQRALEGVRFDSGLGATKKQGPGILSALHSPVSLEQLLPPTPHSPHTHTPGDFGCLYVFCEQHWLQGLDQRRRTFDSGPINFPSLKTSLAGEAQWLSVHT